VVETDDAAGWGPAEGSFKQPIKTHVTSATKCAASVPLETEFFGKLPNME